MFGEIQRLKDNLEQTSRGDAVRGVKSKIQALITARNWNNVETFFREYALAFEGDDSVINILKNEFESVVDSIIALGFASDNIIILDHLKALPWFDEIDDCNYKKGYITEHMSIYYKEDIIKISKLQEARKYYRNAHRDDDVARVQRELTNLVRSFKCKPVKILLENIPAIKELSDQIPRKLEEWECADDQGKFNSLITDFLDFLPTPYEKPEQSANGMVAFFEKTGVIKTVGLSPDGRVNTSDMATQDERQHFLSNQSILLIYLSTFTQPVKNWLRSEEGDDYICQRIGDSLRQNLDWDENSVQYFMQGLTAWLSGNPHIAMSFWLPFFESALRIQLCKLGEDILNPNQRSGIEDFILFDGLLTKAINHYEEPTVEYWRMVFSTHNGLGWNLRNAFCHGTLPIDVMNEDIYSFAVLNAYLFLQSTKT